MESSLDLGDRRTPSTAARTEPGECNKIQRNIQRYAVKCITVAARSFAADGGNFGSANAQVGKIDDRIARTSSSGRGRSGSRIAAWLAVIVSRYCRRKMRQLAQAARCASNAALWSGG